MSKYRRSVRFSKLWRYSSRLHWSRVFWAVVIGGYVIFQLQQQVLPNNGAGGPDWAIGEPLTTWTTSYGYRSLPELRQLALDLVNRDRQLNGLSLLVEDPLLSQVAQNHAEDMLIRRFYDHINPDGQDPSDRFKAMGGRTGAGENIMQQKGNLPMALSYGLVEEYQKGWMYSDGHRENLLMIDYTTFGYGIVASPTGSEIYAVQMFSFLDP